MNLFLWLEAVCVVTLLAMLVTAWIAIAARANSNDLMPSEQAAALLLGTLIPALGIVVLWGRRVAIRRAGGTTARLHVNLVFFFSLIAAIPTLFVAVFASILFQSGVEFWFSDDSQGIMETATELAEGYYNENQRDVGMNAAVMAGDMRFYLQELSVGDPRFQDIFLQQLYERQLSEGGIYRRSEEGDARIVFLIDPQDDRQRIRVLPEDMAKIDEGATFVARSSEERLEGVALLDRESDAYFYVSRDAQPLAAQLYGQAQGVVSSYTQLNQRARVLQLQFNVALFLISLALVAIAVFAALRFADRQVKPLAELADAAGEIGAGNYAMRVAGRKGQDEIGLLNRAFDRMSAQIERQTDALLGANRQLAERRAFMEAVMESITAGVISLDAKGRVLLMNSSARRLLLEEPDAKIVGLPLSGIVPQFAAIVQEGRASEIIQFNRGGEPFTFAVQLSPATEGMVLTFEDITRQLLDQRQAAWSDVARRIAHEIKNPLTPIQLATERLKRRYGRQIEADAELFDELTGTIIRQVGDLRKMVDEFSNFARLPKPIFRQEDAVDLVRQALFLQEVANPDIAYAFAAAEDLPPIACDRHQFGQAMTNVLKNAAEAVEAKGRIEDAAIDWRGRIAVELDSDGQVLSVSVTDNGVGLPQGGVNVLEPYVTTREKGTGLGLAIVKKIVEEHGGDITFVAAPNGGTQATLRFAIDPAATVAGGEGHS